MSKILYVSDFRKSTTGYGTIGVNLCAGLTAYGHEVKALGFQYKGEEHWHPFSIIPCERMEDVAPMIKNLAAMWEFDVLIVGFDIPVQIKMIDTVSELGLKYIAITPLENPPLTMKWAMGLYPAKHIFFISDVATEAAKAKGLEHCSTLHVGVDTNLWKPFTQEEKETARKVLGFGDEKVILQVCTNQERKNLPASFEAIAELKKIMPEYKLRFVLVTTIETPFGYDLNDLAERFGIQDEVLMLEKGMDAEQLRALYGASDCLLLLSKAEGLGLPVLEAFSMEVPMVCTNTGAMTELGDDGRSYLVPAVYTHVDVFGNRTSDFAHPAIAAAKIYAALLGADVKTTVNKAKRYLQEERPVVRMVNEVDAKIKELMNEN
jgi:glycosyltransferase involved in cell wall biosynthesis